MQLEHEHTSEAIRIRLGKENKPNYARDWVYGGIDGAVTTFAIVCAVVGAGYSVGVILIMGVANLIADGFSMAASNYSGTKTEVDDVERLREIERKHIMLAPEGEREEIRQILQNKGLQGEVLEEAVNAITSNHEVWINTMLVEEYGASPVLRSPFYSGLSTFIAFVVCGAVPLLPFLIGTPYPFVTAVVLTGMVFFIIGSLKSIWSLTSWWWSGMETFAIGMGAAGMAYVIGDLLEFYK